MYCTLKDIEDAYGKDEVAKWLEFESNDSPARRAMIVSQAIAFADSRLYELAGNGEPHPANAESRKWATVLAASALYNRVQGSDPLKFYDAVQSVHAEAVR